MKTHSGVTAITVMVVLILSFKLGWAQNATAGQVCPEPRIGVEYAGDDGFSVGGSLIPATNEVKPGHKTAFEIFSAGRRWIYIAEREKNVPSSNWAWKRYGPYDFVGGTRYYSHIGWINYTVGRDHDPRWSRLGGNEAGLRFEVDPTRSKPVVFRIGSLLGATDPNGATGIHKPTRYRVGAIVNAQKIGAAPVPWVFHPNGIFEAPGVWQGKWTRLSDGSLRGVMTCNGVTDDLVIRMAGKEFTAYKSGQPYRWGTLIQDEAAVPPPGAHPNIGGKWRINQGNPRGTVLVISQRPDGTVDSITCKSILANGDRGSWEATSIAWDGKSWLKFSYRWLERSTPNLRDGEASIFFDSESRASIGAKDVVGNTARDILEKE